MLVSALSVALIVDRSSDDCQSYLEYCRHA